MMKSNNPFKKLRPLVLSAVAATSLLSIGCASVGGGTTQVVAPVTTTPTAAKFQVYDNMFYSGKPNTGPFGLIPSNIAYEADIWPNGATASSETVLPSRSSFDALMATKAKAGPLVLDVELLGLNSAQNEQVLATLADWVHQDWPGKVVGYYGTNTLTGVSPQNLVYAQELATHVDVMFPPMYTFNTDESAWATLAATEAAEARSIAPGKPVYFYIWPQYHQGTPMADQYLTPAYWTFELQTSQGIADGVVLWSSSSEAWNDSDGWWEATQAFMATLQ